MAYRREDNLVQNKNLTPSQRRENASKAGKASVEAKRRKNAINQVIRNALTMPINDGELDNLEELPSIKDVDGKNLTIGESIGMNMVINALHGDKAAMEYVVEHFGEDGSGDETEMQMAQAAAFMNLWPNIGEAFAPVAGDILKHMHAHYDFPGGRGSLKSSFVSLIVVLMVMITPETHALVLRKIGNTLRDSVYAQYMWAIERLGVAQYWTAKVAPLELIYKPTGQRILFRGADDPMKIKSIKVPFGYIAFTHFEEKDQFAGRKEIRTILQSTARGGAKFWNFEVYNPPISRDNWANKDSMEKREDRLTTRSTYLDVKNKDWLGEQFYLEAEYLKEADPRAYAHEYMGEATGTGGNVFENLEAVELTDEQVNAFDHVYNGVDWGWFPDPWAFNRVHYDAARRTLYIFDELEAVKTDNLGTAQLLKDHGITHDDMITADSAEPKSVADYQKFGFRCFNAIKGPGSVEYSMKWLAGLSKIIIDPARCPKTYAEFSQYEYERTKDGEIVTGYPDKNNHHIDAVRYALERVWRKKGQ